MRKTLVALMLACGPAWAGPQPLPPPSASPAESADWPMPARDYASTRYSHLGQITRDNVAQLKEVLRFSAGTSRGQESAPIVVDGTLYFVTPFPNTLYALDPTRPDAPLKWKYDPRPDPASQGEACCDTVNRGPTYSNGRLFFTTLDSQVIAVDAATGKEAWRTRMGDFTRGETMTMAPLVVKGKVLAGNSGGEFGVRGWIAALDEKDGRVVWRGYSTGPDAEVLIGKDYQPFYAMDRGKDLGVHTWPADAWRQGGGAVWGWISYDPDLDLVYHGTSNPGPWNETVRPGDNKFTNGIFARDPDTGAARWFYQLSPHDLYDHDSVNENILLDATVGGRERKLLLRPERNGLMYLLDRVTGEVLSADAYVEVNANEGVDLKTGRLRYVASKKPVPGKVVRDICPSSPGSKDWNPSAYSPQTGLAYVPHNTMCMDWESTSVSYLAGTPYIGAEARLYPGPGGNSGEMMGWDVIGRKKAWTITERYPLWSGAAATAGGLVFYGTLDGWFKAVDAANGKLLWKFQAPSGIIGQPTVFLGRDGRQYVAILSGIGGWAGSIVSADLDPRDASAGTGWSLVTGPLKGKVPKGGTLHVFALPR